MSLFSGCQNILKGGFLSQSFILLSNAVFSMYLNSCQAETSSNISELDLLNIDYDNHLFSVKEKGILGEFPGGIKNTDKEGVIMSKKSC